MKQNDDLFKQSRLIRQAANEGKTYEEISSSLNLSIQQIKYRISTRYSEKISHSIFQKLENNQKSKKENNSPSNTSNSSINSKISYSAPALVLDTSALDHLNIKDLVLQYASIILTLDVIAEFDRLKKDRGVLGRNIRFLLSESAKDFKSEKYHVVESPKVSTYTDDNLIAFCKEKENTYLCTADNALANKAKAYGIPYLLVNNSLTLPNKEEIPSSEENTTITSYDVEEIEKNLQYVTGDTTLDNVSVEGKFLILTLPDTFKIAYVVMDSKNNIKKPFAKNMISLKVNDKVLIITYKEKYKLCISEYEIVNLREQNHATFLHAHKISNYNNIAKLDYPTSVLQDIRKFALSFPSQSGLQCF